MQLLLVRCEDCPDLKQWINDKKYLSSDVINELINNYLLRELLGEIREVAMYLLIVDEATDVSHQEQLCISIRWVDSSFNIHEAPIEMIRVPRTDSATLTSLIKDCLV